MGAAEGMNVLAERKKWVEEEQQHPDGTTTKKGAQGADLEQQALALPPWLRGWFRHALGASESCRRAGRTPPWVQQQGLYWTGAVDVTGNGSYSLSL